MLNLLKCIRPTPARVSAFPPSAFDGLSPIRHWVNSLEIRHAALAYFICRIVPVQCPFERDLYLFDRTLVHIPPWCKLTPLYDEVLYDEVVGLRFRILCDSADECGEEIRGYG